MAKTLYEVEGFEELQRKITMLGDDRGKRRAVIRILRKASRPLILKARDFAPKDTGEGAKSIKFEVMRRAKNPMGIVGPRSRGKYDGFYLRQFVIPGHNIYTAGFKRKSRKKGYGRGLRKSGSLNVKGFVEPNPFMEVAYRLTQGPIETKMVGQMEKYIQKQIDKL